MAKDKLPQSGLPIRKTSDLLPNIFKTAQNEKFLGGTLDPLVQPGVLQKLTGYIGRRYGKTYRGSDIYLDNDDTLRSRYQLEPGVTNEQNQEVLDFYDYLDFRNILKFFGNDIDRDDLITSQKNYSWNPPIDWDKFVNYREYYWVPSGPPPLPVEGQTQDVTSTYTITLGVNSFVFRPDGFTNSPTLTLYRGQTYYFKVNAPKVGFVIRTNYDTGSMAFKSALPYPKNTLISYNDAFWKAAVDIPAGSSELQIYKGSPYWTYVDATDVTSTLDYLSGVSNSGTENGVVKFTVPFDAPDILFYQGVSNLDYFGKFVIANIDENTFIDVEKEIIGKETYTSSNGIKFTNGLVVEFTGQVTPNKYSKDTWLVEGVGKAITLTRFLDLVPTNSVNAYPEVLFDNNGFDIDPFDDARYYAGKQDYIVIDRSSQDLNPWSRYNRWFHRDVLNYSYNFRGQDFPAEETSRAKRPIIEFNSNLQLYQHGSKAKLSVDYIDNVTTDIFSLIEGSLGYSIDNEFLFEGARVLVTADKDNLANNKIYVVNFITYNNPTTGGTSRQINLVAADDSESYSGECVLIKRGSAYSGSMWYFNGSQWLKSQSKTSVNQSPLFDVFDSNGTSFSDPVTYPVTSFAGTTIFEYKKTVSGVNDIQLGFPISFLNIDNIGDIQFNWTWGTDTFTYKLGSSIEKVKIATGFYRNTYYDQYLNGWTETNNKYIQPIIDSKVITEPTNELIFTTINWLLVNDPTTVEINFYLNGQRILNNPWTRNLAKFTFTNSFAANDVISLKLVGPYEPLTGYYEIPVGLSKNPLNQELESFTYGEALDHLTTSLEFDNRLVGVVPGASNLRDFTDYQQYASRFMKHTSLAPLALSLLCDKDHNVIKSIEHARNSYTEFKNVFLQKALELEFRGSIADFVDLIVNNISSTRTEYNSFSDSDMIGTGAFTSLKYTVEDTGIVRFTLSQNFSLNTLSKKAVYVYINNSQLLYDRDYEFDGTFGFVTIKKSLEVDDVIEIREYVSTTSNNIPPTPTSLGLYKKYTPVMFLDDTYREPTYVIQGHDGSIVPSYGDFRDDLILELEYRIYNNIKTVYSTDVFDIDALLGNYYYRGVYNKKQLDQLLEQSFLRWLQNTSLNYTLNTFFVEYEPFTYTYSNMLDPKKIQNLPGWWRGVYRYFYDTDRPHRCPWEMLGFSEQPDWWESVYGPAPYTRNNLILWDDLENGIIKSGPKKGVYDRYKRPGLTSYIPVDDEGRLLSPLDSGLAQDFVLVNNIGDFTFGDVSPVEYAWRTSSEYPFALVSALCLMRPFEYIGEYFDRAEIKLNKLNQPVNATTGLFSTLSDVIVPQTVLGTSLGLVQYLLGWTKFKGQTAEDLQTVLSGINVRLSSRLSGFVDKDQQKYLLDTKNPQSTSSSIYIPAENYKIVFNQSSPIKSITYSGVLIEKGASGWVVTGYDNISPYFRYHKPIPKNNDYVISVGGISENYIEWDSNVSFLNGQVCQYRGTYYRCIRSHISTTVFETVYWSKLPKLPLVDAIEATARTTFDTDVVSKLDYGSVLKTQQQVVDFLLGYESFLKSEGFAFDEFDSVNLVPQNWTSACKEFLFWTAHNWEFGSLITLSPAALKVSANVPVGVADNVLDSFYDYNILKADGKPLPPQNINVSRNFENITIVPVNTTDALYYVKLYYVLKEHVVIFDDKTVFNDVIFDKVTGYRQERIKTQGFRTTDWFGDYISPGFIFDNVDIAVWQPYTDYNLGDIVKYKSFYWVSQSNQVGVESFENENWSKLVQLPSKQLIANFDYKINQFEDYYDVMSDGLGNSQRGIARHVIGYQTREYLQNLAEDPTTQFLLYQGFIREKGTPNAVHKVFDKLSRSGNNSIDLNEEWAFKTGEFGGTDQYYENEILLDKNKFKLNPQPFEVVESILGNYSDRFYRVSPAEFTKMPSTFTVNVNPVSYSAEPTLTAGYVKFTDIALAVQHKADILNIPITFFKENYNVWITFENNSWNVYRFNESPDLIISAISAVNQSDFTVTVTLNRSHNLQVDDIIGIKNVTNLTGLYKIIDIGTTTFKLQLANGNQDPVLNSNLTNNIYVFTKARFASYEDIDPKVAALLPTGARLWIDDNGQGLWEVSEKDQIYTTEKEVIDYGVTNPKNLGYKVVYDTARGLIYASMPTAGLILSYEEGDTDLVFKQKISPQPGFENVSTGSFGQEIKLSPDGNWLVVGTPYASNVRSNYKGTYDLSAVYAAGDIVLYSGHLYKALVAIIGNGSTNTLSDANKWVYATNIDANPLGSASGYTGQGMISLYQYYNEQWNFVESFVSPRPQAAEHFGTSISIGVTSAGVYYMAVGAPGSNNNTGKVYLYEYSNNTWSHLVNTQYQGIYTLGTNYKTGNIVWYNQSLWLAKSTTTSVPGTDLTWSLTDPVPTNSSLPHRFALQTEPTLTTVGQLGTTQLAELVNTGDKYGTSNAMSADASILIVGTPYADGEYFENYQGLWNSSAVYQKSDVVKYNGLYYECLLDDVNYVAPDSAPSWKVVSSNHKTVSGKVFVYKKDKYDIYQLIQTIDAGNLGTIQTGDQFGFALALDPSATRLVVSSPMADLLAFNQGSVYVFDQNSDGTYTFAQTIQSFEPLSNEFFGESVAISNDTTTIVVGSKNSKFTDYSYFDKKSTTFDEDRTKFYYNNGYSGSTYVFELKSTEYFLTEKLQAPLTKFESFGFSVSIGNTNIVVGSPDYYADTYSVGSNIQTSTSPIGKVRIFKKDKTKSSWNITSVQEPVVDISKIKSISLYDEVKNTKIQDLDFIDPAKFKILNQAEEEITYKTPYDPAVYSKGNGNQTVDDTQTWFGENVGKLWWDTSAVKFVYYEQGTESYRSGYWNQQVPGSSVNVYEWVESKLLPSEWSALADTNDGLSLGISGQPLYPNDDVYSVKQLFNTVTQTLTETYYYFWVKNKGIVPSEIPNRRIAAASVASYISNPAGTGIPFLALSGPNQFVAVNLKEAMTSDYALINFRYISDLKNLLPVHQEYQLLTEGVASSVPTPKLENKWFDSLIGYDQAGNRVPDPQIPVYHRYGISYRPRQSMFKDRLKALAITIDRINAVLLEQPFAEIIDYTNLKAKDEIPNPLLNLYDIEVNTYADLLTVGTTRVKQAKLNANVVNGSLLSIDIVDPGYGYKIAPPITIKGDGVEAEAVCEIDNQGRVISVTISNSGRLYNYATPVVRQFSVLVVTDETDKYYWGIYSWDDTKQVFYRSRSQSFNTENYWTKIDWWASGYSEVSRISEEIENTTVEYNTSVSVGELLRIKEFGSGGWAVFKKVKTGSIDFLNDYVMVGRQEGTIRISDSLYTSSASGIGYDNTKSYDIINYDLENSFETRNILKAVKENIFINEYKVEWNKLFFAGVKYAFSEQTSIDWAFKTSFLSVTHNVGSFIQPVSYRNDNINYYRDYIDEVKPYRSTVRKFISKYDAIEPTNSVINDFDLPAVYSPVAGKVIPITEEEYFTQYPWKYWYENKGYKITEIVITNSGQGYTQVPKIVITGNGTGATARAFISNGKVTSIQITNAGSNYTVAPTVTIVGGNGNNKNIAKAVAILGDSKVRAFNLGLKFDRISKTGRFMDFTVSETITSPGRTAVINLKYPPNNDKSMITIKKNKQLVLNSDYSIVLYKENNTLKGRIILAITPTEGDIFDITYEKNDSLLEAVDRINKFYSPSSGMIGNDLAQLMTGIDFGGVEIQGTTFDVTGGWDALPWYTDNWDSVQGSSDFYFISTGIPVVATLPYTPVTDEITTVYLKMQDTGEVTRLDDPYYGTPQQTNPTAIMASPINLGVYAATVTDGGLYTVIPNVEFDDSPLVSNTTLYTALGRAIMKATHAVIHNTDNGNGYKVGDTLVLPNGVNLRVDTLNTTFRANSSEFSNILFGVTDFRNLAPGVHVSGPNIPPETTIDHIDINGGFVVLTSSVLENQTFITVNYVSATGPIGDLSVTSSPTFISGLLTTNITPTGGTPTLTAKVNLSYSVYEIEILNYGTGYTSVPAVTFDSGTAKATALISSKVIRLPKSFVPVVDDSIIFRPASSDGSVSITDSNLLDSNLSGGTLDTFAGGAYSTANGLSAENIDVDGGQFTSPMQVPAPEENIPGQVLDSVSIKIFHNTATGSIPLYSIVFIGDGVTQDYDLGYFPFLENASILAYINKEKLTPEVDYYINWNTGLVHVNTIPPDGAVAEILIFGLGGDAILDYQEFLADGETTLYLTHANYADTGQIFVSLNGVYTPTSFVDSTSVVDTPNKTLVQFGSPPPYGAILKIITLGKSAGSIDLGEGLVRYNQQNYTYDGSTRELDIAGFTNVADSSAETSLLVEINDVALNGPDTIYYVYDGTTSSFTLGTDPIEPSGAILISNINVYINDKLRTFITDWVYDGITKVLSINKTVGLVTGDVIKITNNFGSQYTLTGNKVTISPSITMNSGDQIKITWFGEYKSMRLIEDEFTGGKSQYQLAHAPLAASYVWVYKNGQRLTQEQDFRVDVPRNVVYLTQKTTTNDQIKIVLFGSEIYRQPSAFEIFKDMLNVYHFNRFSRKYSQDATFVLYKELNYYDKEIVLEPTFRNALFEPNAEKNIPGVVYINGERIEYLHKLVTDDYSPTILTQLRRGAQGTSIATVHPVNSRVVDVSISENLPYKETQHKEDIVSDGTDRLIALTFTPVKSSRDNWYRSTIPVDFGPCDQIEVFVAGRRLRKDPIAVYSEDLGTSSPLADTVLEAEFSVDGETAQVRLTSIPPAGQLVTVIRRTGSVWYEKGTGTASSGKTMFDNSTPVINFIAQKSTELPE